MKKVVSNNFKYNLDITLFKQGRFFVAYCPALDLSSCGATQVKAKKMIEESIGLFLEELENTKQTKSVLTSLGWKIKSPYHFQPPETIHTRVSINYAQNTKLKV